MDWEKATGIQIVVPKPDQAVSIQFWKKKKKTQNQPTKQQRKNKQTQNPEQKPKEKEPPSSNKKPPTKQPQNLKQTNKKPNLNC